MNLIAIELQPNIPPSPGRAAPAQPAKPAAPPPAGAMTSAGPGGPHAPGGGLFGGGVGMMIIMFVPMLLIIWWMNRSQRKKQQDLESKLKKGDRVITSSGIIGKIAEISATSKYAKLEITSGVKIEILKSAIQGLDLGNVKAATDAGSDK